MRRAAAERPWVSATARPATRGSSAASTSFEERRPARRVEGRAETAVEPGQQARRDAHRGAQHRHVAGQRLDAGQAVALALRGDHHGVGGVQPQRHLGARASEDRPQLDLRAGAPRGARPARGRRRSASRGAAGSAGKTSRRAGRRRRGPAERAPRRGEEAGTARGRPRGDDGRDREGALRGELLRDGHDRGGAAGDERGEALDDRMVTVAPVDGEHEGHPARRRQGDEAREPVVGVHDVGVGAGRGRA